MLKYIYMYFYDKYLTIILIQQSYLNKFKENYREVSNFLITLILQFLKHWCLNYSATGALQLQKNLGRRKSSCSQI